MRSKNSFYVFIPLFLLHTGVKSQILNHAELKRFPHHRLPAHEPEPFLWCFFSPYLQNAWTHFCYCCHHTTTCESKRQSLKRKCFETFHPLFSIHISLQKCKQYTITIGLYTTAFQRADIHLKFLPFCWFISHDSMIENKWGPPLPVPDVFCSVTAGAGISRDHQGICLSPLFWACPAPPIHNIYLDSLSKATYPSKIFKSTLYTFKIPAEMSKSPIYIKSHRLVKETLACECC